jgi:hypothetical protein
MADETQTQTPIQTPTRFASVAELRKFYADEMQRLQTRPCPTTCNVCEADNCADGFCKQVAAARALARNSRALVSPSPAPSKPVPNAPVKKLMRKNKPNMRVVKQMVKRMVKRQLRYERESSSSSEDCCSDSDCSACYSDSD